MSYDLAITAIRDIKYLDPRQDKWISDTQSYLLDIPDFNSEDNWKVVKADNPYETYCKLVHQYWGDSTIKLAEDIIEHVDNEIKTAIDKGYTIEWLGG